MPKTTKPAKPAAAEKPKFDRVWIELEAPRDHAHGASIAAKATKLMRRLGAPSSHSFFWDERDGIYCWGGQMGYMTLSDRGHWFDLDFLSGTPISADSIDAAQAVAA